MFWRTGDAGKACERAQSMLGDRSAGLLSPRRERWLQAHLTACPECSREEELLIRVLTLLDRVPPLSPPPGLWHRVEAQMRADASSDLAALPVRWRPVGLAVTAGTAVALALGLGLRPASEPTATLTALPPESIAYIQAHVLHARTGPLADDVGLISYVTVAGRRGAEGNAGR